MRKDGAGDVGKQLRERLPREEREEGRDRRTRSYQV